MKLRSREEIVNIMLILEVKILEYQASIQLADQKWVGLSTLSPCQSEIGTNGSNGDKKLFINLEYKQRDSFDRNLCRKISYGGRQTNLCGL